MLIALLIRRVAHDDGGFTLIELLVAMVAGLAIVLVLFTMLSVAGGQTTLITDKVQANRLGRQTMTHIDDELHSACIEREFAPIQPESTESKLVFFNAYSEAADIQSASNSVTEGIYRHAIEFNASKGTLRDYIYPSTTEPPATLKAEKLEKSTVIGEHLKQVVVVNKTTGKEETKPVFEYFQYRNAPTAAEANAAVTTLEPIKLAVGEELKTNSAKVAAVTINYEQTPADELDQTPTGSEAKAHEGLELQSQVTLAFSAPTSETPISDGPCE
jgi:type II secretory pathway pseudopilin PulG